MCARLILTLVEGLICVQTLACMQIKAKKILISVPKGLSNIIWEPLLFLLSFKDQQHTRICL